MENRRQDYRHSLLPHLRFPVKLIPSSEDHTIVGVAVDLSVGGIGVQCESAVMQQFRQWTLSIVVPTGDVKLNIACILVHERGSNERLVYGFQFLPLAGAEANDYREKVLWQFLLDDQRQMRRRWLDERHRSQ